MKTQTNPSEHEVVDEVHRVVLRQIVVGDLDTNCWAVHAVGERAAILVDPGDDGPSIVSAVSDLDVRAIVLTHAHFDHVLGLPTVADALGVPVLAHPDDAPVWPNERAHLDAHGHFDAGTATDGLLACGCSLAPPTGAEFWDGASRPVFDGHLLAIGSLDVHLIHTPGHTPGGISLYVPGHVLTGDTLFPGGPGLTGWPMSDFPTIMQSIEHRLMVLPDDTAVHPGHGRSTTIGEQRPQVSGWRQRGW